MPVFSRKLRLSFALSVALGLSPFLPRVAYAADAADEREIVVVDVDASAAQLDADKLRAAIEQELHATAVLPGDPRAAAAKGTLKVEASPAKHAMRITYVARATPTVRNVVLPDDPDAARREAVLVAGNLARDEGAELARELREKTKKAETATPPGDGGAFRPSRIDVARVLEYYVDQERAFKRAVLFSTLGVGVASGAIGAAVAVNGDPRTGDSFIWFAAGVAIYGAILYALSPAAPYEALSARARSLQLELDEAWAEAAATERTERRGGAIASFVITGLAAGVGTWALIDDKTWGRNRIDNGVAILGLGGIAGITGMFLASTDGPIESGFLVFEKTTGRHPPAASLSPRLTVAPIPGGVVGAIGGVF